MIHLVIPYILFILALVPITVYFNQIIFFFTAFYVSLKKFHRKPKEIKQYNPGVSIIKPLMGTDALLRENLVSHFELDYPNFEIVFCVENVDDPAIELVETLFHEYPNVDARLLIGGSDGIINPMVKNFLQGYETAKYDLVWISTSKILVNTAIIQDLVEKSIDPTVAVVHQIPFCTNQRGFLQALEKICFGCSLGRSSIALNHMEVLCFTGMSYIIKKSILDNYGGYRRFSNYLAEDYFLSKELTNKGYKFVMSNFPAQQNIVTGSLTAYMNRMVRWLRLRLNMITIVAAFFEPLIECLNLGILASLSFYYLFKVNILITFSVHLLIWIILDYLLLRSIQNGKLPFSIPTFLLAWWLHELLTYVVYVKSVLHPRTVKWGPHTFFLSLGGLTKLAYPEEKKHIEKISPSQTINLNLQNCRYRTKDYQSNAPNLNIFDFEKRKFNDQQNITSVELDSFEKNKILTGEEKSLV